MLVGSLWLVAKGSKGAEIATSLSLPATVGGVAVSVLMFRLQERREEVHRRQPATPPKWRWAALAAAIILGVGGALAYWNLIHKPDDNVTGQVVVGADGHAMRGGGMAVLEIPGTPPDRDHLALILALTNTADVGDCVSPAGLNLVLYADGQERTSIGTRAGRELRFGLHGTSHQVRFTVTLAEPDPACRVNLGVAEAVLYN